MTTIKRPKMQISSWTNYRKGVITFSLIDVGQANAEVLDCEDYRLDELATANDDFQKSLLSAGVF